MSDWTQVGENLVRHSAGTIYLRAKVKGKVIRMSLETTNLRIAKIARDDRLTALRTAALSRVSSSTVRTLGEAIAVISGRLLEHPDLKPPTVKYYKQIVAMLNATMPTAIHGRTWTAREAAAWWKRVAAKYSAQRANNALMVGKRVGKLLVELGLRSDDPTASLKRLKIPESQLVVPSKVQIQTLVDSIRQQGKSKSAESADYVEFLAYAGCRHGQAKAFLWEHDEGDWLKFPSGVSGTKGGSTRRLPISPALRRVIDRIKDRNPDAVPGSPLFKIRTPRIALDNACERLGIPHVRIHDLRHFFTTYALECGVDVPTVAKWLGHKDGGRLVLKTYGHLRDEHSLASANKMTGI